jgi:hypothetical protein
MNDSKVKTVDLNVRPETIPLRQNSSFCGSFF